MRARLPQQGYIETIAGRRRQIEAIRSDDADNVSKGERQAFNAIMQGSAADVFKNAMLRVDAALQPSEADGADGADGVDEVDGANGANGVATLRACDGGRLILAVHDELIFEVHATAAHELQRRVREAMVGAWPSLRVPLEVTVKQGPAWGDMAEVVVAP